MIKECCGNCKYHCYDVFTDDWVCVNEESDHCSDWTEYDFVCEEYEERG